MARLAELRHGEWQQFERKVIDSSDLAAQEVRLLIDHPEIFHGPMIAAMRAELAKFAPQSQQPLVPTFTPSVWRRETLGLHLTVEVFRAVLERGGNQISGYADQLLVKTPLAATRTTVDLYRVIGRDLGLVRNYNFTQLLAAAAKHNLCKLPAETGPALRESYTDQPKGEVVRVCMEPIAGSDGHPGVFSVDHVGDGRWLGTRYVNPTYRWSPGAVWVFGSAPSKQ